jgi:acyl dehydratase
MEPPQSKKVTFPVEATHILMFARAIGDDNPVYRDAEAAARTEVGGIIAPPTFPMAVEQFDPDPPARPKIGQAWIGSGRTPSGAPSNSGQLYAEQEYIYHRPMRPGDVLTVEIKEGGSWEKEGRRSGKLKFVEFLYEYRDQAGELVVSGRRVRCLLGQAPAVD